MIRKIILTLGVMMIALPVLAEPGRPGPSDGGPSARHLKDRDCVRACRDANRTCVQTAIAAARMCGEETCSDELAAVNAACTAGERSVECQDARAALRACVAPCREAAQTALRGCRTSAGECVDACPTPEPTPRPGSKDPVCVAGCRTGLAECTNTAHGDNRTCVDSCQGLVDDARVACANGRSEACATARKAAGDCLSTCNKSFLENSTACLTDANNCAQSCPTVTPTPAP